MVTDNNENTKEGQYILEGIFKDFEIENKNGPGQRMYPVKVFKKELKRLETKQLNKEKKDK